MPRLDFYSDYTLFITLRLENKPVQIGRADECSIQLPGPNISRLHTSIIPENNGEYSINDQSTNGTRVNSAMIEDKVLLQPGDRIYIGDYVLIYQPDGAPIEELGSDQTIEAKHRDK